MQRPVKKNGIFRSLRAKAAPWLLSAAIGIGAAGTAHRAMAQELAGEKRNAQAAEAAHPRKAGGTNQAARAVSVRHPVRPMPAHEIDAELRRGNSPLQGLGAKISEFGKKYDVNPSFALAIFARESAFGTAGFGAKNKNPANIKWVSGMKWENSGGFIKYPSWEQGVEGFFRAIANDSNFYRSNRDTVDSIIPKWAPPKENATRQYVNFVEKRMQKYDSR